MKRSNSKKIKFKNYKTKKKIIRTFKFDTSVQQIS